MANGTDPNKDKEKKSQNGNGDVPELLKRPDQPTFKEDRLKALHSTLSQVDQINGLPEYEEFIGAFQDPQYRKQFHSFLVNNQQQGIISDVPGNYKTFESAFVEQEEEQEGVQEPDAAIPSHIRRSNMELETVTNEAISSTENLDTFDSLETLNAKKFEDAKRVLTEPAKVDQYDVRDSARLQALRAEEEELMKEQTGLKEERELAKTEGGRPIFSRTGKLITTLPEGAQEQLNENEEKIQQIRKTKNFILQRKEDEFKEEFEALKRLGFNLQKGMSQVKAGAKGMRLADMAEDIEAMKAMDKGQSYLSLFTPLSGEGGKPSLQKYENASPEERTKMKQEALSGMATKVEELMGLQEKMAKIPTNPFAEEIINAETTDQAWQTFKKSPIDIIGSLGITSLPFSTASMAGGVVGGLMGGPAGAVAGIGAGSGSMEYMASITEGIMREVEKKGYSEEQYLNELKKLNPDVPVEELDAAEFINSKEFKNSILRKKIMDVLDDQKAMDRVKGYAGKRAAAIGATDAAGAFLPVKGLTSQVIKGGARGAINSSKIAGLTALGIATDASAGGLGEALAQLATDGEIHVGEVSAELIGELIGGPAEIGGATAASIFNELGYEGFRDLVRGEIRKLRKGKPGTVEIEEGIGYTFTSDADPGTQEQQLEAERQRLEKELEEAPEEKKASYRIALSDLNNQMQEVQSNVETETEITEEDQETQETEEEEAAPEEVTETDIEIQEAPEEASPSDRLEFLQAERERLGTIREQRVQEEGDVTDVDQAIEEVNRRIEPVIPEVRAQARRTAAQEGTIEDVVGQQVTMGEYQGTLTRDAEGNIVIDTGDQIVEVPDTQKDTTVPLSEVGLYRSEEPRRGFRPTEDENVYELVESDPLGFQQERTEPFVFKSANTNEAGEVVSVTMTNAQGQDRTFRDTEQVENVIWDQYFKRGTPVEDLGTIIDEVQKEQSENIIGQESTEQEGSSTIPPAQQDLGGLDEQSVQTVEKEIGNTVTVMVEANPNDPASATTAVQRILRKDDGGYYVEYKDMKNYLQINQTDDAGRKAGLVYRTGVFTDKESVFSPPEPERFTIDDKDSRISTVFNKALSGETLTTQELSNARSWISEHREKALQATPEKQAETLQFLEELSNDIQELEQNQSEEQEQQTEEETEAGPTEDEVPEPTAESEEESTGQDEPRLAENTYSEAEISVIERLNLQQHINSVEQDNPAIEQSQLFFFHAVNAEFNKNTPFADTVSLSDYEINLMEQAINKYHYLSVAGAIESGQEVSDYALRAYPELMDATSTAPDPKSPPETVPKKFTRGLLREEFKEQLQEVQPTLPDFQVEAILDLIDARAQIWAKTNDRSPNEYYKLRLAGIRQNPLMSDDQVNELISSYGDEANSLEEIETVIESRLSEPESDYPNRLKGPNDQRVNYSSARQLGVFDKDEAADMNMRLMGLRPIEEASGEFAYMERDYTPSRDWNFFAPEGFNPTADHIAYLFGQLENQSVEHTFMVGVDNKGEPHILHIGTGNQTSTLADRSGLLNWVQNFGINKVWFVHNHPSGNLKNSRADVSFMRSIFFSLPDDVQFGDGIIIDRDSGRYGLYTMDNTSRESAVPTLSAREERLDSDVPVTTHNFGRFNFLKGNSRPVFDVSSPDHAAMFVNTRLSSLGEDQYAAVILDNRKQVVAFMHLKNKPSDIAGAARIADDNFTLELRNYISRFNGNSAVLVTKQPQKNIDRDSTYLRGLQVAMKTSGNVLDDVLYIQPGQTSVESFQSLISEGFLASSTATGILEEPTSIYDVEGNEESYSIDELAIIDVFESDPTTETEGSDVTGQIIKQLAPVFYRDLQGDHFEAVRKHLGATGRKLTREQADQLGSDFVTYMATNKAPSKEVKTAFEAIKQWLLNIYTSLKSSDAATLPDSVVAAFDSLFQNKTESTRNKTENLEGKVIKGRDVEVRFRADGSETVPGYFALVEARDLQASHNVDGSVNQTHFIGKAQPRDRRGKKYMAQHQQIAQNLNPVAITGNDKAFDGAPSVNERIETIQGNGRSISMKMAYIEYPKSIARYKAYLEDNASVFGFAQEEVHALDQPVLVRVLPVKDEEAVRLGNLKNIDEAKMDKKEEALSSVRNMSMEDKKKVGNYIKQSEADTFRAVLDENGFEILSLIPDINVADYTSDGRITVEGKDFLTDVFRGLIFENESGNAALQAFNIMHDDIIKGIEKSYGILLPLRGTPADLAPLLQQAVRIVDEIKKTKGINNVKDFRSQGDAFAGYNVDRFSEEEFQMAQVLMDVTRPSSTLMKNLNTTGTQKALQLLLKDYENKIYGETNLFGTSEPRNTPEGAQESFREAFGERLQSETQQRGPEGAEQEPGTSDDEENPGRNNASINFGKLNGLFDEESNNDPVRAKAVSWMNEDPATKKGQKLINKINKDTNGGTIGMRSIVNFLNDEIGVDVRIGKEQTTRRNPAHLSRREQMIRSRYPLHTLMFHEAGHAISNMMQRLSPAKNDKLDFEFFYTRDGSMASAQTNEEGWAEWVRLYIKNPEWTKGIPVTSEVESILRQEAPEVLDLIQDTARAYRAHINRGTKAILRSSSKDYGPSKNSLVYRTKELVYNLLYNVFGRNWAINKFENQAIYKPFVQAAENKREARKMASDLIGKYRMTSADFRLAHQVTNRIPTEVEYALNGFKGKGGIRAYATLDGALFTEEDAEVLREAGFTITDEMTDESVKTGKLINFTDITVEDVVKSIDKEKWDEFETYAQAKVSLDRVLKKMAKYPGWEAAGPRELMDVVQEYEDQNKTWPKAFDRLNEFMDSLLLVAVAGGDKKVSDAVKMKETYDFYLPLPRRMERRSTSSVSRSGPTVDAGYRGLKGTGDIPMLPLLEAIEGRVYQVMDAYYTNRAMLAPYRLAQELQNDDDAPQEVKFAASRFMVPLKLDTKKVATLNDDEMGDIIANYLNQEMYNDIVAEFGEDAANSGMIFFEPIKADDIIISFPNKGIWRKAKPNAVNVVAGKVNGETHYFQVEDPVLFNYFAMSDKPSAGVDTFFNTVLSKMTAPWKRILTQVVSFAIRNTLARDPATAIFFGLPPEYSGDVSKTDAAKHMVPGYFLVSGIFEMITNRKSDPVQHGELLSRSMSRTMSPAQKARSTEFGKVLKEGIVISGFTEMPNRQKFAEIPGIAMSALLKPLELIFHYTGQTFMAQMGEESHRIGAYKAAKKAGMSDEAAQLAYDLVTGNFSERPGSPTAYAIYRSAGFLNPAVQIFSEQLRRVVSADPGVRSSTAIRYGFIGASTMAIWALNRLLTPEDRWDELQYRTDDEKLRYIPMFGQLRVPFDYGPIGALQSFTYNMMDNHANEVDIDSRDLAIDVLRKMTELPVTPDAMINPQVMSLIEAKANFKFYFNEPIVPGFLSELPNELQVYTTTPGFYRRVAELNDYSPLKVQHVVRNAFGSSMDEVISFADRVYQGDKIEKHQYPFVGRLVQRTPSGWFSQPTREVSDLNSEYDAAVRKFNSMSPEDREKNPEEVEKLKEIWKRLKPMNDAMNTLQKQYETVKQYRDQERYEDAKEMEKKMTEYAASVLSVSGRYE